MSLAEIAPRIEEKAPSITPYPFPDVYIPQNADKNILFVGSGGREHALAWKARHSEGTGTIYVAPGNGGTEDLESTYNVHLDQNNFAEVAEAARDNKVELVVVGPEEPLVKGIADYLSEEHIPTFGPTQELAMLEGSKVEAVRFMRRNKIPHPNSLVFDSFKDAYKALSLNGLDAPYWFGGGIVVKADGLAAGKGVFVCDTKEEAYQALNTIMVDKKFGDAGERVVIQEKLDGFEVSAIAIVNGTNYFLLPFAEDHKQAFDNDEGPNTGGMGILTPHPLITPDIARQIEMQIIIPTIAGIRRKFKDSYRGALYAGLMMTRDGPRVLEYNVRFGDPETEGQLPILSDELNFTETLDKAAKGTFRGLGSIPTNGETCVVVTLASKGYPGSYEKGKIIEGVDKAQSIPGVTIFHAGTKRENGQLVTDGGRVLFAAATGPDVPAARDRAYGAVHAIEFERKTFRGDIPRLHR